jgi:hypothetical protein
MSDINRRTFLTGISAAAGLTIVPRRVLGGQGFVARHDPARTLAYSNEPDRYTLAAWIGAGVIGTVREVHN